MIPSRVSVFSSRAPLPRYEYEEATGKLARAVDDQRIAAYTFDPTRRLAERRAALQTGDAEPGERDWQVETFAYDGNGNLALATNAHSRLQWFHDEAGNLVREHQHYTRLGKPLVAVCQHEYDALDQRSATVRPDGHRVSWLTFGSGHLLALQLAERQRMPSPKALDNRLKQYAGTHYQYDAWGNLTQRWTRSEGRSRGWYICRHFFH